MKSQLSTPKDLAEFVNLKLKGAKTTYLQPSIEVLSTLFETLFYTSLKTEEGQFIKVTVTFIDPNNSDPSPPERIVADRWKIIPFSEPITFSVKNLVKLSKAVDPWSSSLAVYYDEKNELKIWGLLDQALHYQSFLNYESNRGPEQPGLFQTTVKEIGCLNVIFDYELIATLKQNILISNYIDVFGSGPISTVLSQYYINQKNQIKHYIDSEYKDESDEEWEGYLQELINESLSRILLRIQNYSHGGAILITPDENSDLDIKHKISYDRMIKSMVDYVKLIIQNTVAANLINMDYIEPREEVIPMDLYLDENVSEFLSNDTKNELKGSIRFVSSLSCIDGLVVISKEIEVKGFGGVIKMRGLPEFVYSSNTSIIHQDKLIPFNPDNFGTRHRSMFSYCWNNQGSIGFVVSQDGDIRAIMKVDDKLIMWENITVQQFIRSEKLKRGIDLRKYN